MPRWMGSTPVEQSRMVMAMTAAEDCTMQVITVPMARNERMVRWLDVSNEAKNATTASLCSRSSALPAELSITNDQNMKAMPNRKSPT